MLQNEPKDILENFDGLSLESFTGLYNKVGFVNGEKYWLSEDKKWAIYTCTDKNWIVGSVQGKVKITQINIPRLDSNCNLTFCKMHLYAKGWSFINLGA